MVDIDFGRSGYFFKKEKKKKTLPLQNKPTYNPCLQDCGVWGFRATLFCNNTRL